MENLTDVLVSQMLNSFDPAPVYPTQEQKFLAFLICKNLSDLCETGRAILHDIELRGHPLKNLPEYSTISLCKQILDVFYSNNMFIKDPYGDGNRPNWSAINSFDNGKSSSAYKIYRAIRNNVVEKPDAGKIQDAVRDRNREYFLENYDKIFADIPFREGLARFKNFLVVDYVKKEHLEYVWDFFDSLLDIFIHESENIEDLKSM